MTASPSPTPDTPATAAPDTNDAQMPGTDMPTSAPSGADMAPEGELSGDAADASDAGDSATEAAADETAGPQDTPAAGAPAAKAAPGLSPAECADRLRALFPALFSGPPKPIKLRIQADIQARAQGVFTKGALSAFLRRYTGSTSYLIALTRAPQRIDLDGHSAGDISEEHRQAAADELNRRRTLHESRRQAEEDQRRERFQLLRAFETSTLTKENFCALKGMTPEVLDDTLALARQEAEQRDRDRAAQLERGHHDGRRDPRQDRRPAPGQPGQPGRADARPGGANPGGPSGRRGAPEGSAPRRDRGPRQPR
jgi:ProP effector